MVNEIEEITLELTTRCNLRCRICSLWRESIDLPLEPVKKFIEPFFPVGLSLTGGEPFLWPNFDDFLRYLLAQRLRGKVTFIHISTNGTLDIAREKLERLEKFLPLISITVSLDGVKEVHDRQRGVDGSFDRALKFILWAKRKKVKCSLKMVITSLNQFETIKVWRIAKELEMPIYFKPYEVVNVYYHRFSPGRDLCPDSEAVSEQLEIVYREAMGQKWLKGNRYFFFALDLMRKYFKEGFLEINSCNVPSKFLFVTSEGRIFSCLYLDPVGDIFSGIDVEKFRYVSDLGIGGKCGGCLAYHGYVQDYNL